MSHLVNEVSRPRRGACLKNKIYMQLADSGKQPPKDNSSSKLSVIHHASRAVYMSNASASKVAGPRLRSS